MKIFILCNIYAVTIEHKLFVLIETMGSICAHNKTMNKKNNKYIK